MEEGIDETTTTQKPLAALWKYIAGSTLIASMCCLPSVVMVMFGLATVSTGAALSNTLYWGEDGFGWFRGSMLLFALICVVVGLIVFFRNQGICSFDEVKRNRRKIVNTSLLAVSYTHLTLPTKA